MALVLFPPLSCSSEGGAAADERAASQGEALSSTTIVNIANGLCLADAGYSKSNGTQYVQWTCDGGWDDSFAFTQNGDGSYQIQNTGSSLCMNDLGWSKSAGSMIGQWSCDNKNSNQNWILIAAGTGAYELKNAYSGLCASFGSSNSNGTGPVQESCGGSGQAFKISLSVGDAGAGDSGGGGGSCPSGTFDLVSWFLPANMNQHLVGSGDAKFITANAAQGKMYFVKNQNGYPLDEKTYDNSFVRDFMTENGQQGWTNPKDIKFFAGATNPGVKLGPRCVPNGPVGTKLATVQNDKSTTYFYTKTDCAITAKNNLGYVLGEVWNTGFMNFGGSIGDVDTRTVNYKWACDSSYANCQTIEKLILAKTWGWVEWQNWARQSDGSYKLLQTTMSNTVAPGNVGPVQPCGDAPVP